MMFEPLKKYAVFKGRARRKEYWLFTLFCILLVLIAVILDFSFGAFDSELETGPATGLVSLAILLPSLAVGVRRLHDTDKSGWLILLTLVPIGNIVLLVFFCLNGTNGDNRFGADPKSGETVVP